MEAVVNVEAGKIFQGNSMILSDVHLTVERGEFVYLIGKTGTGKSSLLKTLYGDIRLQNGKGTVCGIDLNTVTWKTVPYLRRKLGIVFQDFQLLTDRNVHDNLKFVLKATAWNDRALMEEKINSVLEKVGLAHKASKMPYELSGGEQQRVDIARSLLNNPSLILADEPTGNLDPDTADDIMNLLITICKDYQTAIIMATHDYNIINRFPARIIRTEGGLLHETQSTILS
jgi:cell division transport system ATP-binding protein